MADRAEKTVFCEKHGESQATFVCQHLIDSLRTSKKVGFFQAEDPGNPRPDAWCGACETQLQQAGGVWTDKTEAFAGVSLMCGGCYDRVKTFNQ